jgi:hypothetical protein
MRVLVLFSLIILVIGCAKKSEYEAKPDIDLISISADSIFYEYPNAIAKLEDSVIKIQISYKAKDGKVYAPTNTKPSQTQNNLILKDMRNEATYASLKIPKPSGGIEAEVGTLSFNIDAELIPVDTSKLFEKYYYQCYLINCDSLYSDTLLLGPFNLYRK